MLYFSSFVLLIAACTSDGPPPETAPTASGVSTGVASDSIDVESPEGSSTATGNASIVLLTAKDPGVLDGLIQARYVVRGGCAYIDDGDVGVFRPAIWPAGTQVDADGESIVLPDGFVLTPGDLFEATGGLVEDPASVTLLATAESAAEFVEKCGASDAAFLVADGLRPFE